MAEVGVIGYRYLDYQILDFKTGYFLIQIYARAGLLIVADGMKYV